MKHIIENANEKHHHYSYRILYVETLKYLKSLYPMRADKGLREYLSKLKTRIKKTETELEIIRQKLEFQKAKLVQTCPHPIIHMHHSGYACSGTSSKFISGMAMKEHVVCGLCGDKIYFEAQEVCEEYRNDD